MPEAREIFSMIYDTTEDSDTVTSEVRNIQLSLELSQNENLSAMFRMGPQRTLHRVVLATTIQIFLQMSGINSITYYASTIYEQSKLLKSVFHTLQLTMRPTRSRLLHNNSRRPRRLHPSLHHPRRRRLQFHRRSFWPPQAHAHECHVYVNLLRHPHRSWVQPEQCDH